MRNPETLDSPNNYADRFPVHDHVIHYFEGERREMFAIIAGSVVLTLLVLGFVFVVRDPFSKGLAVTVAITALLLAGTAGSLLARDASLSRDVISAMKPGVVEKAVEAERSRIDAVISKYKYYRYGAAGLGLLALLTLVVSRRGWAHGAAAGLLLLVLAQVLIDHYSERRARQYAEQLRASGARASEPAG